MDKTEVRNRLDLIEIINNDLNVSPYDFVTISPNDAKLFVNLLYQSLVDSGEVSFLDSLSFNAEEVCNQLHLLQQSLNKLNIPKAEGLVGNKGLSMIDQLSSTEGLEPLSRLEEFLNGSKPNMDILPMNKKAE